MHNKTNKPKKWRSAKKFKKKTKTKEEWTSAQQNKKRSTKTTTDRRDKKVKEKQMRGKVHKQTRQEWDKMQDKCEVLT